MVVNVTALGTLTWSLPDGRDRLAFEKTAVTVRELLDSLVLKHGEKLKKELFAGEEIRNGISLLVNGRNVLSLPDGFDTPLRDGDELIIAVIMAGG